MFSTEDKLYIGLFLVVLGAFFLNACGKKYPSKSVKSSATTVAKDPVTVFCGVDCSGCGYSVDKCLSLVKGNLPNLCRSNNQSNSVGKKENCYMLWMKYAKTCRSLCAAPRKIYGNNPDNNFGNNLADEKKMTTMTVFEGGHPL